MQTPCASQRCWIRAKWFRDKRTRHTVAERKFVRCSDSLECFYLLSASSHPLYLQNYTKYLSANTLAHNTLKWAKVALKLKNNIHTSRSAPPSATKSNSDKREWSFLCAHKKQEKNAIEKLFSLEVCVGCLVLNIVAIAAQRLTEKRLFHPEIMAFFLPLTFIRHIPHSANALAPIVLHQPSIYAWGGAHYPFLRLARVKHFSHF